MSVQFSGGLYISFSMWDRLKSWKAVEGEVEQAVQQLEEVGYDAFHIKDGWVATGDDARGIKVLLREKMTLIMNEELPMEERRDEYIKMSAKMDELEEAAKDKARQGQTDIPVDVLKTLSKNVKDFIGPKSLRERITAEEV